MDALAARMQGDAIAPDPVQLHNLDMTLICYQSLNSSSSTDHGLEASTTQYFTGLTHNKVFNTDPTPFNLVQPTSEKMEIEPLEGPAQLIGTAPSGSMSKGSHSSTEMRTLVERKARQFFELAARIPKLSGVANGAQPDIMAFGEIDSGHADWSSLEHFLGKRLGHGYLFDKACQAFSLHSGNTATKVLAADTGWIAVEVNNLVVVFVHVPNGEAKVKGSTTTFYRQMFNAISPEVDLILGDTNQPPTVNYTVNCVNQARGNNCYAYISDPTTITPSDSYQRSFNGTNSTATQMYDIALYNTARIKTKPRLEYVSQFVTDTRTVSTPSVFGGYYEKPQAVALTDHMGMIVYVE